MPEELHQLSQTLPFTDALALLEQCLKSGVYVNDVVNDAFTLLHMAVLLPSGWAAAAPAGPGTLTARANLRLAAKVVQMLLEHGASPIASSGHGEITAMHLCCYYDGDPDVVGLLAARGVRTFERGPQTSPLEMAANQGNWKILKYIFENKAGLRPEDLAKLPRLLALCAQQVLVSHVGLCLSGQRKCER